MLQAKSKTVQTTGENATIEAEILDSKEKGPRLVKDSIFLSYVKLIDN